METPFSLGGKRIFITGASSGIGRSIAIRCSELGAELLLTGRDENRLRETMGQLAGKNHMSVSADLREDADIEQLVAQLPKLDGIVLCAGLVKTLPIKFVKRKDLETIFNINLHSSVILLQRLLKKRSINSGASVCWVSSIASRYVTLGNAMYSATKGAVNSFTRSLALELAPKRIRVNAILPGLVETNILKNGAISAEQIVEHQKNYPIGRFGKPDDVAYLAIYLLSEASSWMTGSLLTIDGGYSIK